MEPIQSAVVSAAREELRQRWPSFDEDRPRLETTLTKSRILIDKAERWSFKDARLAQILTQLKDAAYDAEDVLDDIDCEDQQKKIQGQHSQVSQLLLHPLNFVRNLMNNTAKSVRAIQGRLDMTAANLEGLMDQLGLHGDYRLPANREMGSVVDEATVYGRDEDREKVIKLLGVGQINNGNDINESVSVPAKRRKKDNVSVLSIYGIGGVGKTTLAQIVYNDQRVADHFELKIWICVSDKFDANTLSKQIIDEARRAFETDLTYLNSLQVDLKKIAMEHRFLLILDDVWNENTEIWQKFYAPLSYGKEGSMILVTTRTWKIASITGTVDPILLEGLSGNVYQEFFESCAFGRKNPKDYPQLENIGRNIAAKLKGSPLAAKTLGSLLNDVIDEGHWTTILNSELWELPQKDDDILPALRLSYQYLPPHLKSCFSFCSIFPKDYEFDTNELVSIWVALGFVIPQGNMLLEDIATMYLRDLTSRCFFQQSHRSSLCCVMHDLMHDLAQFVSVDECTRIDEGRGQPNIPKTVRHLSICPSNLEKKYLTELGSYGKLRSIIILSEFQYALDSVIDCWFRNLTNIRCLKLRSRRITQLPESISNLKHLRYFDVSDTSIRMVPDSLCHLNNLQVLNIINGEDVWLTQGFTRLHNLRIFHPKEALISKIRKIGGLTSLQYWPRFNVGKDDEHKIGELKHMTQLRRSLHITGLQNVGSTEDARQAKLDNKPYLDELILEWSPERSNFDHDMEVLEGLQPHQKLKKLTIKHYGGTTSPSWLQTQTLTCLSELCIENCSELRSLGGLDALASLKEIAIRSCPRLEKLSIQSCKELRSLVLDALASLKEIAIRSCPKLEKLSIWSCEELHSLGGLDALASLKEIAIRSCPRLEKLSIQSCKELRSLGLDALGFLEEIAIRSCPKLEKLSIQSCTELRSLGGLDALASLKKIDIRSCPKLADSEPPMFDFNDEVQRTEISLSIDRTTLLKLQSLSNLAPFITKLKIFNSDETKMFVGKDRELLRRFQSLKHLKFDRCRELKSLPTELHRLTSLQELVIINCSEIHSLPRKGLPASLTELDVDGCNEEFERQLEMYKSQKNHNFFLTVSEGGRPRRQRR